MPGPVGHLQLTGAYYFGQKGLSTSGNTRLFNGLVHTFETTVSQFPTAIGVIVQIGLPA